HDADSRLVHGRARSLVGTTGGCANLDPSNPMTYRDQTPQKSQISHSVGEVGLWPSCAERKNASAKFFRRPRGRLRQLWESAPAPLRASALHQSTSLNLRLRFNLPQPDV